MLRISSETKDGTTLLRLVGPIDDQAAKILAETLPHVGRTVTLNLAGIEYFNSLGIRAWVNFLKVLVEGRQVYYEECPMDVIQQINMMPAMSRGVEVLSFQGDFACPDCGHEQRLLFSCKEGRSVLYDRLEQQPCERCGGQLQLEDDPKNFLLFLKS